VISFGKFRTIDLGDLLWNNEYDFMCPNNLVGTVDLYLVSHHGTDPSGSPALVHGLQPRVAISQNGTRKGGTLQTAQTLNSSPNFQDHWQLHWSYNVGTEWNPAGIFIANIDEPSVIATILTSPPPVPGAGRGGQPSSAGGPVPTGTPAPATTGPVPAGSSGSVAPPMPTPSSTGPPAPAPSTAVPAPAGAAVSGPPQPPTIGAQTPAPATPVGQPGGPVGGNRGGGRGGGHTGPAFWIKVSAQADGTFTITNTRNGFSRTYRPR
jgi:hypothetical protein